MSPETIALAKNIYDLGAPATYLFFLVVLWRSGRRDQQECRDRAEEVAERYEALLRESVSSLTRVAEVLDRRRVPSDPV